MSLLDASDVEIGLTLTWNDREKRPNYSEAIDTALASQFFSGEPNYSNLRPEREFQIGQMDFRPGFGIEFYDANDPKRYYYTVNGDARFKDMFIPGPLAASVSLPGTISSAATLQNKTFEADANWTNGDRDNGQAHGGTFSWKVYNEEAYQNAATWSNTWREKTFSFGAFVYSATASNSRVAINDGQTTTYSSYHTGGSDWEFLTATKTLAADATRLRCILADAGQGGGDPADRTYFDDCFIGSPIAGAVGSFCEFDSDIFFSYGQILCRIANADGVVTAVHSLPDAITNLALFTDDNLYIALGADTNYCYMDTSEELVQSDITGGTAEFFATVGITLWKGLTPNELKSATDPTNAGSWSAATTCDSTEYDIISMLSFNNLLYIMKEDRPFYVDSDGAVQILTNITRPLASSTGGVNSIEWQGNVYMPWGTQGLLEYASASAVFSWRDPSSFCTNLSAFDGRVMALAYDERYIYAIIDNATAVEILAGRLETVDGTTAWGWHPITQITLTGCQAAYVSSVYKKRLWIGSTASDEDLYYIPITTQYGDIVSDSDYTFQTGGYIVTPWYNLPFRGDPKSYIKISLDMADTTANIYYEAHYQIAGDTTWTDIGDFKTSPTTEKFLPNDSGGNEPQSTRIRFKFVAITNDSSTPPKLFGFDCRGLWYPKSVTKYIFAQVKCADNITRKDGNIDEEQTAATIRTALEELADPAKAWPRTFYPPYYDSADATTTLYVKLVHPLECVMTKNEYEKNPEYIYNLILEKVALS